MAKALASRAGGGITGTTTIAITIDPDDIAKFQAGESVDVPLSWGSMGDGAGNKPSNGAPDIITLAQPGQ